MQKFWENQLKTSESCENTLTYLLYTVCFFSFVLYTFIYIIYICFATDKMAILTCFIGLLYKYIRKNKQPLKMEINTF